MHTTSELKQPLKVKAKITHPNGNLNEFVYNHDDPFARKSFAVRIDVALRNGSTVTTVAEDCSEDVPRQIAIVKAVVIAFTCVVEEMAICERSKGNTDIADRFDVIVNKLKVGKQLPPQDSWVSDKFALVSQRFRVMGDEYERLYLSVFESYPKQD